ncbi:hypothetical protein [Brevibacillus sp. SYP-B805]|nr:hypothetical protein [Brevibacillus sp. SYP-B805]
MDVKMACEKCGAEPEKNEEKSNENWSVYGLTCSCGGRVRFVFEE